MYAMTRRLDKVADDFQYGAAGVDNDRVHESCRFGGPYILSIKRLGTVKRGIYTLLPLRP